MVSNPTVNYMFYEWLLARLASWEIRRSGQPFSSLEGDEALKGLSSHLPGIVMFCVALKHLMKVVPRIFVSSGWVFL